MGMKRAVTTLPPMQPGRRAAGVALAALLTACATRELPARYPNSMPASPEADAPRAPAAAMALADEPGAAAAAAQAGDAALPSHPHGAHHGH
jgi:hypothetical protein